MPNTFSGISMASHALRMFQRALDTSGHNIANVNTPGFSRQRVEFGTNTPLSYYSNGEHMIGQGVNIMSITRIRDGYLDTSYSHSLSQQGRYSAASQGLSRIEAIYNEPSDSGISAALTEFFNAWSGLGSNPGDASTRGTLRNAAQTLTDRIRSAYQELQSAQSITTKSVNGTMNRIDELAQSIAVLNKEIVRTTAAGGTANDLMDQRDMAIDELSKLVPVTREVFPNGEYAVYAAGFTLVDTGGARAFPRTYDSSSGTVTDGSITYRVRAGELAGHFESLNAIAGQMSQLDDLANGLRTEVNALHQTGTNQLGNTGVDFFNGALNGALDFDLSADVKADAGAIASGITGNVGDGSLAHSIARLQDAVVFGSKTFEDYFQSMVGDVAYQTSYLEQSKATEDAVLEQIDTQRQAVMGVSLDDEMADMMKYQRSYQAAARALTVMDQMTEDLIGMLRR